MFGKIINNEIILKDNFVICNVNIKYVKLYLN